MGFGLQRAASLLACCAAAAGLVGACTFPDFVVPLSGAGAPSAGTSPTTSVGGTATEGGSAIAGGGVATVGGSNAIGGSAGTVDPGMGAASGAGGDETESVPVDIGPCGQRPYPTHCWNHKLDPDETDVDCGGRCAPCPADDNCSVDRDCSLGTCQAGKCERLFTLQYLQQVPDEETASFRFEAVFAYAGKNAIFLRDVTVRYYFSRNDVTEPILGGGNTIGFPTEGDISGDTQWNIVRQLRGDGITNDAYLEIAFTGGRILNQGDSVDMTADAITGDGVSLFNQKTHYSFDAQTVLHESKKLSVHYKGQRVWGTGPAIDDPPSCLHLGVNLDGPAYTVGDDLWLTSPASVLARYIDNNVVLKPATDKGRENMIRSGFFFHSGDSFSYPVNNGNYSLLAYAWSANGSETGTLQVQADERDTFHAKSFEGGGPWVALGPYRVTVNDGQLKLTVKGDLRIGGMELRLLDE